MMAAAHSCASHRSVIESQVSGETGERPVRARRREVHELKVLRSVLTRSHIRGHVIGEI